jgi:hypothetical protein
VHVSTRVLDLGRRVLDVVKRVGKGVSRPMRRPDPQARARLTLRTTEGSENRGAANMAASAAAWTRVV